MSKRKPPKGCFWRGGVLWGRIQTNGGDVKWSLRTDDPVIAAQRRKTERDRKVAIERYGDARRTFADAMELWAKSIKGEVGPNTLRRYATSLKQLQPHLDGLYLDEIDKTLIGTIVEARKAQGVANATIKRDLTALSSVIDCAIAEGWMEDNPVLAWLRPNRRKRSRLREMRNPIVLPDPRHVQMVVDRAPGLFSKLVQAARATGCRQNELVYARRTAVNHPLKQLTVVGKGNKQRVIDLGEDGAGYEVFQSMPLAIGSAWLFWHHGGQPYRTCSGRFRTIVKSVAKQAQKQEQDFRPFTFHHLRHLHAVEWLKSGRSIYKLQKRLGHSSIKTTEMYLEYLTPDEQLRVQFEVEAGTKSGTAPAVQSA